MDKAEDLFLKKALRDKPYQKIPLAQEGSDRRYFRVFILDKAKKAKQLKHLIKPLKNQKNVFSGKKSRSYILSCASPLLQKTFLQKAGAFSRAGLNVPEVYVKSQGFALMEDLGDYNLEKEKSFVYYKKALKLILKIQSLSKTGLRVFTKQDFLKEMLLTEKHFIKGFCKISLSKKFRAGVLQEWKDICQNLARFPKAPAHRDFHSKNLFIKGKKLYMIDFQDAGLFPRFYDAVSLICDLYPSWLSPKERKALFDFFIRSFAKEFQNNICPALSQNPPATVFTSEDIKREIFITALQRLFKAVGSFAGFYQIKKQKSHLKYIDPALKMIKKLLKEDSGSYPFFRQLMDKLCPP